MELITRYLIVGAAGSLGAMLRMLVSTICFRCFGPAFPVGTMVINLSGSLFLGWFLTVMTARPTVSENLRIAVTVGFVGAYTTFSTFAYESSALWDDGAPLKAAFNMLGSLALGLFAVRLGIWLGTP
jgi:fluoride exporter